MIEIRPFFSYLAFSHCKTTGEIERKRKSERVSEKEREREEEEH